MPMDPILAGVAPVNAPKKPKRKRTNKQDAQAKHSAPAKSHKGTAKLAETFGLKHIDRDLIEERFAEGMGRWHPSNVECLSEEDLRQRFLDLDAVQTPEPFVPTAQEVFGDKTFFPSSFVGDNTKSTMGKKDLEGGMVDLQGMNQIMLPFTNSQQKSADGDPITSVSLEKFAHNLWRNIAVDRTFNTAKAVAYSQWLKEIAARIDKHMQRGNQYNLIRAKWQESKNLYEYAKTVWLNQASWDAALTPQDVRELDRIEADATREKEFDARVEEKVNEILQGRL